MTPPLMTKSSMPAPWLTFPPTLPEAMSMLSLPAPKVTSPVMAPLPDAGNTRRLSPLLSTNAGAVPLSQV